MRSSPERSRGVLLKSQGLEAKRDAKRKQEAGGGCRSSPTVGCRGGRPPSPATGSEAGSTSWRPGCREAPVSLLNGIKSEAEFPRFAQGHRSHPCHTWDSNSALLPSRKTSTVTPHHGLFLRSLVNLWVLSPFQEPVHQSILNGRV